MRNKKKNKYLLLLILLLGITLGYAAISTTLKITGTANVNKNTWSVYWDEESIEVTPGSVNGTAGVSDDGTVEDAQLTWTADLNLPGDFYEFTIDAVNAGSIDAMITNITPTIPADLASYINYSVTYADGIDPGQYHLLAKGTKSGNTITPTREKYKIRVEYLSTATADDLDDIDENGDSYTFGYSVTYAQATDAAINRPVWILPQGRTKDNLQVGDEICAKGECFNFIKYDGNDVVMLAKYNLKVGYIYSSSLTKTGEYTSSNPGYGLQSSEARGWVSGETGYGTVAFSATNYWNDNGSPSSSYPGSYYPGPNYPTIYDSINYKTEPDFSTTCDSTHCFETPGYSVAYYVDAYKTLLTNNGLTIKNARILTYAEATDVSIGCDASNFSCPTTGNSAFITNTTFWLGSAYSKNYVWSVSSGGSFDRSSYNNDLIGVRPVIVIEKSNL